MIPPYCFHLWICDLIVSGGYFQYYRSCPSPTRRSLLDARTKVFRFQGTGSEGV